MKHFIKLSLLAFVVFLVGPQIVDAASCSGTAVRSNGDRVPFSYTIVGKKISGGSYEFGNQTYNGVTSSVRMSFSNPNLTKAVANTCFSQDWMNKAADSAAYFIPQFLQSGRTSWTQSIISCGNTHVYTKNSPAPVNGVCGTARNTCSTGSSSNTNENSTSYTWSCGGSNGGTTAQCSLNKDGGRNGGGNDGGNPNPSPAIPQPVDFNPFCTAIPNYAAADGDDAIAWTVRDRAGRSFSGYNFAWTYTGPQGVNFRASNEEAVLMTSSTPVKINLGQVSVRVYGGTVDKTAQCPSATFGKGITATFAKPIVEPSESCRLSWSGIDVLELPICKIYDQTNTPIYDIVEFPSGFRDVPPNSKYYIKCEAAPDPENPDVERGVIQSEFLQCIRRGELIEI